MDILSFTIVMTAALMHASWNLAVKKDSDQFLSLTVMAATSGLLCAVLLLLAPGIQPAAWPYLLISAPLHAGYRVFLAAGYRAGDMSQVYPIARGATPVFVMILSLVTIGVNLDAQRYLAIALIAAGIVGLTFVRGLPPRGERRAVGFALTTAGFVACFTLLDAAGARHAGSALPYILWVFVLEGLAMMMLAALRAPSALVKYTSRRWRICLLSGLVMSLAHGLIIWALSRSEVALVSALRETSVIIGMVLSAVLLRESIGSGRVACTLSVVGGIVLISL